MRYKLILAAAAALAATGAVALPPPVPVSPVVTARDAATADALRALIADMARQGHFDAALAEPPGRDTCTDVGDVMRATCYATAARMAGNPNLVFLHVEPAEGAVRLHCIGPDQGRAQRAELSLAIAAASDPAGRAQRQALASCLIGALHAPSVPTPPAAAPDAVVDEPPPPEIPPLPHGHHDRPPPLGSIRMGTLEACDRALPDGRRYDETEHGLQPRQRLGLNLAAHGFAPILHVFRRGEPDRPLATLAAPADGSSAGLLFTAPDEAEYVFRIVGADAGARGRWRLELDYRGLTDLPAPDPETWFPNACGAR